MAHIVKAQYFLNNTSNFSAVVYLSGWLNLGILATRFMQSELAEMLRGGGILRMSAYSCYEQHDVVDQNHGWSFNCYGYISQQGENSCTLSYH